MDEIITVPFIRLLTIMDDKESAKNAAQFLYPDFVVVSVNEIFMRIKKPSTIYQKEIIGYFCPCNQEHPHDAPEVVKSGKFVFND